MCVGRFLWSQEQFINFVFHYYNHPWYVASKR